MAPRIARSQTCRLEKRTHEPVEEARSGRVGGRRAEAGSTQPIGTGQALAKALTGFSNTALALVAAALFLSVAMTASGLVRRIACRTLNPVGTTAQGVLVGAISVTVILSLIVPSATARVACLVPIMSGIIAVFGGDRRSMFGAPLMIVGAQATRVAT